MNEGLLGEVDPVVLRGGQPLGHDVGVGQRTVGLWGEEEEGRGG